MYNTHTHTKKRKVIRNGNKKEINANIKIHTDTHAMHTEIHTQIGSIITIKKRENIPKTFFIHFLCNAKHRQQNTAMRHWRKKNFPMQKFFK